MVRVVVKSLHILSWVYIGLTKFLLALSGLYVIPIALVWGKNSRKWPNIFWLWGNDEEGPPDWFYEKGRPFPSWWWHAIRNPVNNMRFLFKDFDKWKTETNWDKDNGPMEAHNLIRAEQDFAYRWNWSGLFAGYRSVRINEDGTYTEKWFGWKVGSVVPGLGFTMQWRRHVKVGE